MIDLQRRSQAAPFPVPPVANNNAKPKAKSNAKKKDPKLAGKGPNFTKAEIMSLLETLEDKLPVGPDKWRIVAAVHHETNGWPLREYSSLRKKFQKLVKEASHLPTGESDMPEQLREARRVHNMLRSNVKAADPSNENGGALAVMGEVARFNGLPAVSSDQVVNPDDSDLEEEDVSSIATGSVRLDGPKALTAKRGSSSSSASKGPRGGTVINTIEALLAQQVAQQMEDRADRRRREEERREETKRREEDRADENRRQRQQNKQWMRLCLIGIGAVRSGVGGREDGADFMQQLATSIGKDDSEDEAEDRPAKTARVSEPSEPDSFPI